MSNDEAIEKRAREIVNALTPAQKQEVLDATLDEMSVKLQENPQLADSMLVVLGRWLAKSELLHHRKTPPKDLVGNLIEAAEDMNRGGAPRGQAH